MLAQTSGLASHLLCQDKNKQCSIFILIRSNMIWNQRCISIVCTVHDHMYYVYVLLLLLQACLLALVIVWTTVVWLTVVVLLLWPMAMRSNILHWNALFFRSCSRFIVWLWKCDIKQCLCNNKRYHCLFVCLIVFLIDAYLLN